MADPSQSSGVDMSGIASALINPFYINPAYATPAQRDQLYEYSKQLMAPQPIKNGWQGLASIARALVGGYEGHQADMQGQAGVQQAQRALAPVEAGVSGEGMQTGATPPPTAQPSNSVPPPSGGSLPNAIVAQESGGNPNVGASTDGALGPGQIMPATFQQYAKPGESITNPTDNLNVSHRIVADYTNRYGGDPARVATAYFSGPGNVAPPGSPTPYIHDYADGNGKTTSSYVSDVLKRVGGAPPAPPARPQGTPPITAQQLAAMDASPWIDDATKARLHEAIAPQNAANTQGDVSRVYENQPPQAGPMFRQGIQVSPTNPIPMVPNPQGQFVPPPGLGGTPGASGGGATPAAAIFGPNGIVGQMSGAQAATNANNANIADKQKIATARFSAAQEAGPQLMSAAYPLRQLQAIMAKNGGMIPSGEGSEQLMRGLSVANMLGTLLGHPIADADSNLPTLELLKKYGMQAAQAQSQALGLHTNLGLESSEITSPNPALSGPANAHLVDNLVRLNQVAQKKAQFDHDLFLQNGQRPDAYDNATALWQQAISGRNAIPLASAKFGHQYTNAKGQKRVIVPSTDPSGFSVYSPDDPAVADIGPQAR